MTRRTVLVDRVALVVTGLALVAAGAAAVWWWLGRPLAGVTPPGVLDTGSAEDTLSSGWGPYAAGAAGLVLALIGLRWILAHLRRQRVARLTLRGSRGDSRLEVLAPKVVDAAADAFADVLGVRSARGTLVRDRGQLVARIDATIEPEADLGELARRADEVTAQLVAVLGREDVRSRVRLGVARRGRSLPRVGQGVGHGVGHGVGQGAAGH